MDGVNVAVKDLDGCDGSDGLIFALAHARYYPLWPLAHIRCHLGPHSFVLQKAPRGGRDDLNPI